VIDNLLLTDADFSRSYNNNETCCIYEPTPTATVSHIAVDVYRPGAKLVLKETFSYYVNHQTTVFCTFHDARKAFSRKHCKLFELLFKRKLLTCIIRVLINYIYSYLRITWGGVMTDYFSAVNGVEQDAVLIVLLSGYLDDVLTSIV
jgi:hypothetical protein